MAYKVFDKKTSAGAVKSELKPNKQLAEEPTGKFEKRKVHWSFIDNTWGADRAYLQLISKSNKFNKM